jgi:hypothetical protein
VATKRCLKCFNFKEYCTCIIETEWVLVYAPDWCDDELKAWLTIVANEQYKDEPGRRLEAPVLNGPLSWWSYGRATEKMVWERVIIN